MTEIEPLALGLRGFRVRELLIPILKKYSMPWEMIVGPRRYGHLISVRHEIFYVLRAEGYSYGKISIICKRDNSTIIHGVKRHKERSLGGH